ncbi:MAG TPA: hypothetical protein VFR49_11735 [Solirubrobacteraceae bacterium]|nr:hypothetical protein [Solirubrobacteraceae bacterium]
MSALVPEEELEAAIARVLELPEGLAVGERFAYVGDCRPGFYKSKLLPRGKGLDFEILVAQAMIDVDLSAGPSPDDLARLAHIVSHARLVLAGSRLPQGPYGDLFYRVLIGFGAALDQIGIAEHGAAPSFDDTERIGPPIIRLFLNQVGNRFAEALRGAEPHTCEGELVATIASLRADLGREPPLVAALVKKTPMVITVHKPVPGWAGSFTVKDFMDATLDPVLSESLASVGPL